jgi:glutamate dehydrogenase/leucine dehydrogenase
LTEIFTRCDDFGPEKILHISNLSAGLQAIVVIDNTAAGPSIGGVRMATDVSLDECARLARAMTLKNAAAGLPYGGGKAVIFADPAMPQEAKERLLRAFAQAIRDINEYIPGPDMGTNETCMAWVQEEICRAVGLPRVIGGIPLDVIGATGLGVAAACEVAQEFCDFQLQGARVAVQGFGAVGIHAARFLAEKGATLVAASDSGGTVSDPNGLDLSVLIETKSRGKSVTAVEGATDSDPAAVLTADCDILVPAARPDVITADNARHI